MIIGDPKRDKTEALMRAMGRFIDQLGGEYITGEDVGTTLDDMEMMYAETDHVVTLPVHCGGAGDISPATALGSIEAMRACARAVWGSPDLRGRSVALQGLGVVGSKALRMLVEAGANVARDRHRSAKVAAAEASTAWRRSSRMRSTTCDVDIFAPYALGADHQRRNGRAAQGQGGRRGGEQHPAEERHGDELSERGIVYAVDYIANSGGTIFDTDRCRKGGFQPERALAKVREI